MLNIFIFITPSVNIHIGRPTTDNLHRLPRVTLFQPHLCIFAGNSEEIYLRDSPRHVKDFPGLYGIYRLAIKYLARVKEVENVKEVHSKFIVTILTQWS